MPTRCGSGIIPTRKTGGLWKDGCPAVPARNDILRATSRLAPMIRRRWSGDHVRIPIEAGMGHLKSFGERIASGGATGRQPKSASFAAALGALALAVQS